MKAYKNNVFIEENKVIKNKKYDVKSLYDYLNSVSFDNIPDLISSDNNKVVTRYIENTSYHEITPCTELIKTVASLHSKTLTLKDVSKNKYKKIYTKLLNNIEYLNNYYNNIINNIEYEEYMSPSHYLFARNYSSLDSSIKYARSELKNWYNLVKDKSKERVCTLHNNLSKEHFIKGDKNYLISWDNYLVDTPILDLYKFYKKEGYKLNFNYLLNTYYEIFSLLKEEKILLNILISIPPKISFSDNEYLNTINIKNFYNYIYSSINVVNQNK